MRLLSAKFYSAYAVHEGSDPQIPLINKFAREMSIHWACQSGSFDCLDNTFDILKLIINRNGSAPKGLEEVIYCNGLRGYNKRDEWVWMWRKMKESKDSQERNIIINSLACSDDDDLLVSFMESVYGTNSDVNYSYEEQSAVLNAVAKSRRGVSAYVKFMEVQFKEIQ
jgi:hypothetical protein